MLADRINIQLDTKQRKELAELNTFNIEGRYEEEKLELHRKATIEYTNIWLRNTKQLIRLILP